MSARAGIILAAGQGTRMKSARPKVMHAVAGQPILGHVMAAMRGAGVSCIVVVAAPDAEGAVLIDFNRSANLPCAYTDLATCPLPPAENRLPVPIEAGEKIPFERLGG